MVNKSHARHKSPEMLENMGLIDSIHDANTEQKKAELFAKVRSGQVRFLLGSTQKMGAGTNVQDRLIALHHLDVPWRPSEEGRAGRNIRKHSKIKAFRYSVTVRHGLMIRKTKYGTEKHGKRIAWCSPFLIGQCKKEGRGLGQA